MKDSLGGRESQALRTVRAKRDADEAGKLNFIQTSSCLISKLDREYRKGVHWLETLRLRRTKILESGYKVSYSCCRSGKSFSVYVRVLRCLLKNCRL